MFWQVAFCVSQKEASSLPNNSILQQIVQVNDCLCEKMSLSVQDEQIVQVNACLCAKMSLSVQDEQIVQVNDCLCAKMSLSVQDEHI